MDSDKNIEYAEFIVKNDMIGRDAVVAQAAGTMACAYALIAIAKELQATRKIMEKTEAKVQRWGNRQ